MNVLNIQLTNGGQYIGTEDEARAAGIADNLIAAAKTADATMCARDAMLAAMSAEGDDMPAIIGTNADATGVLLDFMASLLATLTDDHPMMDSFDRIHGAGAFAHFRANAQNWIDGRADKKIRLPLDIKGKTGFADLFADLGQRSGRVTQRVDEFRAARANLTG